MPRLAHLATDEERARVNAYAAVGVPHHEIAKLIGISTHTLLKCYQSDLDTSKTRANAQVAGWLFELCRERNLGAIAFWLKCQGGWRERSEVTLSGDTTHPIVISAIASKW